MTGTEPEPNGSTIYSFYGINGDLQGVAPPRRPNVEQGSAGGVAGRVVVNGSGWESRPIGADGRRLIEVDHTN